MQSCSCLSWHDQLYLSLRLVFEVWQGSISINWWIAVRLVNNVELNLNFCPFWTLHVGDGKLQLWSGDWNDPCCLVELYMLLHYQFCTYFDCLNHSHNSKVLGLASLLLPVVNLLQTARQLLHKQRPRNLHLPLLARLQVKTKWKWQRWQQVLQKYLKQQFLQQLLQMPKKKMLLRLRFPANLNQPRKKQWRLKKRRHHLQQMKMKTLHQRRLWWSKQCGLHVADWGKPVLEQTVEERCQLPPPPQF